jgi:hypothetical protein
LWHFHSAAVTFGLKQRVTWPPALQWHGGFAQRAMRLGGGEARSPNSRSPTFVELANTPGMTAMALTVALTTPHAGMPMFVPTADERENIIAYILSLKK